jgi:DNA recombination protein RmuC
VTKRGEKIEALEFVTSQTGDAGDAAKSPGANPRVADSKTGQLRLRVVEERD